MKRSEELQEEIDCLSKQKQLTNMNGNQNRAQSISVGNAGGSAVEITMRSNDGTTLWRVCQPVEITELIHQLASSIGCHINIQPRDDFSSWRTWNGQTAGELRSSNGHAPFGTDLAGHMNVGGEEKQLEKKEETDGRDAVGTKKLKYG